MSELKLEYCDGVIYAMGRRNTRSRSAERCRHRRTDKITNGGGAGVFAAVGMNF